MKKYRYTSTTCFKVGEYVWVTGIKVSPSGKRIYMLKPTQCLIKNVFNDRIEVSGNNLDYRIPRVYYLDLPENNVYYYRGEEWAINSNIAIKKEDAIENYNTRLESIIDSAYLRFKNLESWATSFFL